MGGGDFNEIISSSNKIRGNSININRAFYFWDCINHNGLIDLGFRERKYTLTNKRYRNRSSFILERLDRCLSNEAWLNFFPEASVTHLPKTHFDHPPLLLCLKLHHFITSKSFRMETIWCFHPSLSQMVRQSFDTTTDLTEALAHFQAHITTWNRDIFGNIFHRKKNILDRIDGIQRSKAYPHSQFFHDLKVSLTRDYSSILQQEQEFWRLKSIISWLAERDCNTRFFHTTTMNRRRGNKINSLKDDLGN